MDANQNISFEGPDKAGRALSSEFPFLFSAEQVYSFFLHAPMAVSIFSGENLHLEFANKIFEEYLGTSAPLGLNFQEAFPDLVESRIQSIMVTVYKTGKRFNGKAIPVEKDFFRGQIETRYFDITLQPMFSSAGVVDKILVYALETTSEMRVRLLENMSELAKINEEILQKSKEQMQNAVRTRDQSLSILKTINSIGQTISAELNLERLVQKVTDEATVLTNAKFGAFFYNVVSEKNEKYTLYVLSGAPREAFANFPMPRNTEIFRATFEGISSFCSGDITKDPRYGKNYPYRGMPPGHLTVTSYLAVPVVSRSGEVLGGLFFGHPLPNIFTEKDEEIMKGIAAQVAVGIDNARLFQHSQDAIRMRDEFLSIASHELKTPLTPLKIQMQLLKRHLDKDSLGHLSCDQIQKIVLTSEKQINRLTCLVDDLLDVARINAGKLNLNKEELDFTEVLTEVLDRFSPQLAAAGCHLTINSPKKLRWTGDRLRIEQVIINLLSNATKYAAHSPIHVTLKKKTNFAQLFIKDHGSGIPVKNQNIIFDRFERHGTNENLGGLGLGLFITRQIVEAHGGTIWVESSEGDGAMFVVNLPLHA